MEEKLKTPRKRQSKGLGDTIEKMTKATGIKAITKFIAGEDCGCEERKDKLNNLFKYKRPKCLTESEYEQLDIVLNRPRKTELTPVEQYALLKVYNRIFEAKEVFSTCGSCLADLERELRKVYELY